ncbi:MAG TPA: LuxR C-terminal-related transcriptional regulator [Ktedonobacteraceae bacterium]|jgi:signal transduction histidine kinase/DNA-binding CsgD family transcriptional regulator|nr:LuxR C-terminal-related transcriptional regulator [Ktedonobacteraceae bacterium]
MVRVDKLLQFITQLQGEENPAQRRYLLLHYIRTVTDAQCVALFVLDKMQQKFVLLTYDGLRRRSEGLASATRPPDASSTIPSHGPFGAALNVQGLLTIPDLSADEHSLAEERMWSFPGGRTILSPIRENNLANSQIGLLVIAFPADTESTHADKGGDTQTFEPIENEGDILVCITLLSTYLSPLEQESTPPHLPHEQPERYEELDQAIDQLLRRRRGEQQGSLPELLYSLSSITELYEIGLIVGTDNDIQELYQHILTSLSHIILAQSSCLLVYEPTQQHFIQVASQGNELPYDVLARSLDSREMERLAVRGPGETIAPILLGEQRVLLITLSYNSALLGIVALATAEIDGLLDDRSLLLSYMGNVAALILKNHELHMLEVQDAIEHERNRIARDIHDGPVQNAAHVLHRLEIIQQMLETPSITAQEAISEVKRTAQILEMTLTDLRHDIASLLPLALEEQGFTSALEALINEYRRSEPHLEISYQSTLPFIQASTLQGAVFRYLQEALNNVRKHAQARHVTIQIRTMQHMLVVEVHDDGIGIQNDTTDRQLVGIAHAALHKRENSMQAEHFGLRSMEERIRSVGGTLEIVSQPGSGTSLKARFPLPHQTLLLTQREREILRFISQGWTNGRIALKLSISRETVKSHVHHIMQKLHVHDRTQAAVIATRQGWL